MAPERRIERLALALVGEPPSPLHRRIAIRMSEIVPIPCGLRAEPLPVATVLLEGRDQVDADLLLASVESQADEPGEALCGLVGKDIGHVLFTYFFGRARRDGNAMVVSLARLAPGFYGQPDDEELLVRRATREILHEFGHVAGLHHCDVPGCIMHFAATVEGIDGRGDGFCRSCGESFHARLAATHRSA
jgi:predicted Zn-dependent protease